MKIKYYKQNKTMKRLNFYLAANLLGMLCCANAWGGNTINYTSSEGTIDPYDSSAFGEAKIVSNTCEDGQGVITFDGDLTTIGNYAFEYCSSLESVTLPEGLTTIGSWAFSGCSSLESITFPESMTTIGDYAFSHCSYLSSINIPKNVTTIDECAFCDCPDLQSITVDGENEVYDSRNDCNAIIETATRLRQTRQPYRTDP